jgi:hypothetical protein
VENAATPPHRQSWDGVFDTAGTLHLSLRICWGMMAGLVYSCFSPSSFSSFFGRIRSGTLGALMLPPYLGW